MPRCSKYVSLFFFYKKKTTFSYFRFASSVVSKLHVRIEIFLRGTISIAVRGLQKRFWQLYQRTEPVWKNDLKTLPYAQLLLVVENRSIEVWSMMPKQGSRCVHTWELRGPQIWHHAQTSNGWFFTTNKSWAYGKILGFIIHTRSVRWYSF